MTPEALDELNEFREKALAEGIPPDDVERWTDLARPCALMNLKGTGPEASRFGGPVVGRLGGPLMLPADAPDPWCGLAATIDLAALPAGATDLDLPADGHLLLFADPDIDGIGEQNLGTALHVPAGTPVEERRLEFDSGWRSYSGDEDFAEGPLHMRTAVSLPAHATVHDPEDSYGCKPFPGHPHARELCDVWAMMPRGIIAHGLQLGGYAWDENDVEDPSVAAGREAARRERRGERPPADPDVRPEDWVCLAQWIHGLDNLEAAFYSWSISRQDLAARRFDRVYATMTWNP
ncbi:DUF1963 domain-containing protein [Streptomyces althioticus]|uniref:DUF1963 domain-containing protein n=1 Tax=Streptomyces althioticus TaxID=83380 RepID=UPI0036C0B0BF